MTRVRLAALALALLAPGAADASLLGPDPPPPGAPPADARVQAKSYAAATFVPPETACSYNESWNERVSAQAAFQQTCFGLLPTERNFSFQVQDSAGGSLEGWYVLHDAHGHPGPATYFCRGANGTAPQGTKQLYVVLWGPALDCPGVVRAGPVSVPRVATVGTVKAWTWP